MIGGETAKRVDRKFLRCEGDADIEFLDRVLLAIRLLTLRDTNFAGAFWSHYIWWAIGRGLRGSGNGEGADAALRRAAEELARFAARVEDVAVRAAFSGIPMNARILQSR